MARGIQRLNKILIDLELIEKYIDLLLGEVSSEWLCFWSKIIFISFRKW